MPASAEAEEIVVVGEATAIVSASPCTHYGTAFEDDGETGYFYALDKTQEGNALCDAMHVYDVQKVPERFRPVTVEIVWSEDGLKSALAINGWIHAVFDFEAKRGYCRQNYPPPDPRWSKFDHAWDDEALRFFESAS